ncbi:MAG: ABC transporter ATP-binding protein [Candidatus Bathyarchaeota archaeon]|nr:MAG: ABC transporter ATP-binding protein [Candidatus Bathyarchaeota archaeon]
MSFAVEAEDLAKSFGNIKALDGLSFRINPGEIYGLIGPNGAGKTTALRIISTLILPTSGYVKVHDHDVVDEASVVRKLIAYLPEEAGAYKNLSGEEYLRFMASFSLRENGSLEEMVAIAAQISGLGNRLRDKVKTYSKGMKRRLLVARALMTRPKLAVLDEPTSGLDVLHSVHVREIIKQQVKKYDVTVLISSHNMLEVEYLCEKVALINHGKIIAEGTPDKLKIDNDVENLEEAFAKVVGLA